ncbi:MAG TPA: hypothetical protein ENL03_01430, partial [Phycisphaerae bacterium]|nr:hypothetical protein [Phycisphaerae bacterium]
MRNSLTFGLVLCFCAVSAMQGQTRTCTLTHHGNWDAKELLRLPVRMSKVYDGTKLLVKADGREVPYQVEVLSGTLRAVSSGYIWVYASLKAGSSITYTVTTGAKPKKFRPKVVSRKQGDVWMLNNGLVSIGVGTGGDSHGPVAWIRPAGLVQRGSSRRITDLKARKITVSISDTGPLFRKVRVREQFDPDSEGKIRFADCSVTLVPDVNHVLIEENHRMNPGDCWQFNASADWTPKKALTCGWYSAKGRFGISLPNTKMRSLQLKPNTRLGGTAAFLQPSWTKNPDVSWFFGAADDSSVLGSLAIRAGKWDRPVENRIECRISTSPDVTLSMPTHRGRRQWLLVCGPIEIAQRDHLSDVVFQTAVAPLDKLQNEYVLAWPGMEPGELFTPHYYEDSRVNPAGPQLRIGNGFIRQALSGQLKGGRRVLSGFQVYLDPDFMPWYGNHCPPPKPYLATMMLRIPISQCAALKKHPKFKTFTAMAASAFRRDLYHS